MMYPSLALIAAAAAEGGEGGGGASLLLPHTDELIWGTISFLILLGLLMKVAFPAAKKALQQREEKIRTDLERAEEARSESEKLLDDYRERIAKAREEAATIVDEARKTAEGLRREIIAKAEEQANEIVARARLEAENERRQAIADVYREAGKVAIDLAERIIGETIDPDVQRRLVDQYIRDVESMASSTE
jgi:F-type H+-transporting ATPase subunit b